MIKLTYNKQKKRWRKAFTQQTPFKWDKASSFKNNIISFTDSKVKPSFIKGLANIGLQTVDYYGTPVITKSPWFITPKLGN